MTVFRRSWKQIYPRDCYSQMLILAGETDLSFPKVVNILVREGLISLGKIPRETSQAYLLFKQPAPRPKEDLIKIKRTFMRVEEQFETLKPTTQEFWKKKAKEYPELEEAKKILRKIREEPTS